jgi:formate transporter
MSYVKPPDFVRTMIDSGQAKTLMSTRDTLIRAVMAGAILALAAAFAVTVTVNTGNALVGALLFPVGFSILYLMGFDLVTGVFMLVPLAWLDRRPGVTWRSLLRNWGLTFVGNFIGALVVAVIIAVILTHGFQTPPDAVGMKLAQTGVQRTLGYEQFGVAGMITLLLRAMLCNWMVCTGVVGAMMSTTVPGKVIAMWMPILVFFYMSFEHSVVNMFLFPTALLMGGAFSVGDYFLWNEIPTLVGNVLGGMTFVGFALYFTHHRTRPSREPGSGAPAPAGAAAPADETVPADDGPVPAAAVGRS